MSAVSNLLVYNIGTASQRLSLLSSLTSEPSDPAWYGKIDATREFLIYLIQNGASAEELESILNLKSGLAGLSGLSGDTRAILPAAIRGNMRAMLALDVFIHRLRAGIGGMIASLGGVDAIVFTDRIAEDEPVIRKAACEPFEFLGLELHQKQNAASPADADIASARSRVGVLIIRGRRIGKSRASVRSCIRLADEWGLYRSRKR